MNIVILTCSGPFYVNRSRLLEYFPDLEKYIVNENGIYLANLPISKQAVMYLFQMHNENLLNDNGSHVYFNYERISLEGITIEDINFLISSKANGCSYTLLEILISKFIDKYIDDNNLVRERENGEKYISGTNFLKILKLFSKGIAKFILYLVQTKCEIDNTSPEELLAIFLEI